MLSNVTGPVVGDPLADLLDRCDKEILQGKMPVQIFGNQEVFDEELTRIFAKTWMFLGHASEIPNKGDYVVRRIGTDAVIVVRGDDDVIRVLSNYCRHRATELCQVDQGNATNFTCPYHGWIYKNTGEWQSAPKIARAYRELDPKEWGLFEVPNVDSSVHGMIYACVAEDAEPLLDFLGETKWFLDIIFGLHPEGMRVVGPPTRWRMRSDWKSGPDNFVGDNYHVDTTHYSMDVIGALPNSKKMVDYVYQYDVSDGFSFTGHNFGEWFGPDWDTPWGYPHELSDQFDMSNLDEGQMSVLNKSILVTGNMWPNLSFIRFPGTPDPANVPPATYTQLRQFQPIAPGIMEFWVWQFAWNIESEEYTKLQVTAGTNAFSSAGLFEQDDTVVWEGFPRAGKSIFPARTDDMALNFQLGFEGMSDNEVDPDWTGPGEARMSGIGESGHRNFYRRWIADMRSA
jgi:phenylpropionate dioxygenase-like ring-hydroxylating dioxygenase large terminal subunit